MSPINLDAPAVGAAPLGGDQWIACNFHTGYNPGGYTLDSIQLLMADSTGGASGFSIAIYAPSVPLLPEYILGYLSGPEPFTAGVFTYTASGITLLPGKGYWFAVTADTNIDVGAYRWSHTDVNSAPQNGWSLGIADLWSNDGVTWGRSVTLFQFAITATPVPEPSSLALLGVGGLLLAVRRWHRRE